MVDNCLKKLMICEECGGTCAWSILRKLAFSDRMGGREGIGKDSNTSGLVSTPVPHGHDPYPLLCNS
jgi:hypothetical protein